MSESQPADRPTAFRIAGMSWRTGLWAWQHLRLLMGSAAAALLLEDLVFGALADVDLSVVTTVLLILGVETAIAASVAVAIHRLVLLDERDDRWIGQIPPQFTRFFCWLLLTHLDRVAMLLLPWLFGGAASPRLLRNLIFAAYVIEFIVVTRCLTLFPAIAIDAAGGGARAAWHASKGHFWMFFRTVFCVALVPLAIYLGILILAMLFGEWFGFTWLGAFRYFRWWNAPLDAVLFPTIVVAMAAAVSILYRDVANRAAR